MAGHFVPSHGTSQQCVVMHSKASNLVKMCGLATATRLQLSSQLVNMCLTQLQEDLFRCHVFARSQ